MGCQYQEVHPEFVAHPSSYLGMTCFRGSASEARQSFAQWISLRLCQRILHHPISLPWNSSGTLQRWTTRPQERHHSCHDQLDSLRRSDTGWSRACPSLRLASRYHQSVWLRLDCPNHRRIWWCVCRVELAPWLRFLLPQRCWSLRERGFCTNAECRICLEPTLVTLRTLRPSSLSAWGCECAPWELRTWPLQRPSPQSNQICLAECSDLCSSPLFERVARVWCRLTTWQFHRWGGWRIASVCLQ